MPTFCHFLPKQIDPRSILQDLPGIPMPCSRRLAASFLYKLIRKKLWLAQLKEWKGSHRMSNTSYYWWTFPDFGRWVAWVLQEYYKWDHSADASRIMKSYEFSWSKVQQTLSLLSIFGDLCELGCPGVYRWVIVKMRNQSVLVYSLSLETFSHSFRQQLE